MTKFKQNFFTGFEQTTKNDKKDYNTGAEKFLIKTLSRILERCLIKGPNWECFVKNLKTKKWKVFNKNLINNFKKGALLRVLIGSTLLKTLKRAN